MRLIFSLVKNIFAIFIIIVIIYIALKYAPFLRDQEWNPVNNVSDYNNGEMQVDSRLPRNEQVNQYGYTLQNNDLLRNIPKSQVRNVFQLLNKQEFMRVSGISRMGYNDEYLAGQRDDYFIIYKFGSDKIRVYNTEIEMQNDLMRLGQSIPLKGLDAY